MRKTILLSFAALAAACQSIEAEHVKNSLRAPAYPLITIDPYTSAWAFTDNLYDGTVKHWTGKDFPLLGVVKVDGEAFRFLGKESLALIPLSPTSEQQLWVGKYTTEKPAGDWTAASFSDAKWKTGKGAFGTIAKHHEPTAKTEWQTEHIWVRRTVDIPPYDGKNVYLEYANDDDAVFYINGEKVEASGCCNKNKLLKLPDEIVQKLKPGKNLMAAYCNNTGGNALLDFGLYVEDESGIRFGQTALQRSVDVQATQTQYEFTCGKVDLTLTFTSPLLPDNLELLSRPVSYISYELASNDGMPHDVELSFEATSQWATNTPYQLTNSEYFEQDNLHFLKTGTEEQAVLAKKGDDLRIDWGYFYLVAEKEWKDASTWRKEGSPVSYLSLSRPFGEVKQASGKIMLGYDDLYSIQYFGENLRPYWNRSGEESIASQFRKANDEYDKIIRACSRFDAELMQQATAAGGKEYAELCALAYRQAIAAHKLVQAPNGDLLFLSKENFSNGSIGTVDITYPSAPLFLLYNPELCKALMNHIFYYSESGKWPKPFAAHDVGTYPLANGQTYGGDMPVEESGNMLILTAAIAQQEGNAGYAEKHWDVLTTWTNYLVEKGLDPENQLCTDDFAGHFAHNANLSIKAILGIAAYGRLADMLGKQDLAKEYTEKAKAMAQQWVKMADDGDHYRLTFDKQGTWSQKYNLVWDKLLKLEIFPSEVAEKEIPYYLTKQNPYGLPLDNRKTYTKADWIVWTATLANDKETFEKFIGPLHAFANETPDRAPMPDWYFTDKPKKEGFQARAVVGGFFIKALEAKNK